MKSKKQKLSKNICNLSDRKLDKFLNLQSILQSQYERIGPNFQKKKKELRIRTNNSKKEEYWLLKIVLTGDVLTWLSNKGPKGIQWHLCHPSPAAPSNPCQKQLASCIILRYLSISIYTCVHTVDFPCLITQMLVCYTNCYTPSFCFFSYIVELIPFVRIELPSMKSCIAFSDNSTV